MPRKLRAVLFDLDDTLYPMRRFLLSGFAAVAREIGRLYGFDPTDVFAALVGAFRGPHRGRECQVCLASFNLPPDLVTELVDIIRWHLPSLRLPRASRDVLENLRPHWRLGIVTNGHPAVQRRKVRALGLNALVDTVVCASEHGLPGGKPRPEPFLEAVHRLRVEPGQTVFVGDDESVDIDGAARVGMATVLVARRRLPVGGSRADAVIASLVDLPAVLADLSSDACEGMQHVA